MKKSNRFLIAAALFTVCCIAVECRKPDSEPPKVAPSTKLTYIMPSPTIMTAAQRAEFEARKNEYETTFPN